MLGSPWVAAQLAASQECFSSMELVIIYHNCHPLWDTHEPPFFQKSFSPTWIQSSSFQTEMWKMRNKMKTEALGSPETLVHTCRTARCHGPEAIRLDLITTVIFGASYKSRCLLYNLLYPLVISLLLVTNILLSTLFSTWVLYVYAQNI
jgi:hypothetical protein